MPGFEFHPFLQSHEIPNKKSHETSGQEAVLNESENERGKISSNKNIFQPHDQRLVKGAIPFNASGIAQYMETESENETAVNTFQEYEESVSAKTTAKILQFPVKERPFDTQDKLDFINHPVLKENAKLHYEAEAKAKAQENIRLFRSANVEKITGFLLEDKIVDFEFAKEIEKTKQEYATQLADASFLTYKHWKILTGLRLFNKETLEHSIGTFVILKEKINRLPNLKKEIASEGINIEQLFCSALLHDEGKIAIPDFILNSKVTDHEWAIALAMLEDEEKDEIFIKIFEDKNFSIPDSARHDPGALAEILEEKRIRAVEYVPIKSILTADQLIELENYGFSGEMPLKKIMEAHEKKSEEILQKLGFVVEAMLAGNHHNYLYKDKKLGEKPASLSALHISIEISSTIIHLADVQHALSGDRTYHHKNPMLRILAFLVDDARKGKILPGLTAAWIRDEMNKMNKGYLEEIRNMSAPHQDPKYLKQRKEELELIEEFLEDNLDEQFSGGQSPFPKRDVVKKITPSDFEETKLAA